MRKITVFLLFFCIAVFSYAQKVTGFVYDSKTSETLPGVSISYKYKGETIGTMSNVDGSYEIKVPLDAVNLIFTFLGYQDEQVPLVISNKETLTQNVYMKMKVSELNEVVVSVGRYEQKLSDVTVSTEILKPEQISRQDPKDLRSALTTISGVDVTDKQPSIRGGSGWTYGVGSRSLIMLDGMSILTPDVGEINWNTIPMENIQQVEVIKGASSVLYGSSALNGLINVRTKRPSLDPETNISAYVGIYGNPTNSEYTWWSKEFWKNGKYEVEPLLRENILNGVRNPIYTGVDFSHARRIGNFDVSAALNLFTDEGYRNGGYNKRMRGGGNLTYHDPNHENMNYGFNINALSNKYGEFFIWESDKHVYNSSPLSNMGREENVFYVDPFFNYTNPGNNTSHKIKSRFYYKSDNIFSTPNDKNLLDIMRNMGVNDKTMQGIGNIVKNPTEALKDYWGKIAPSVLPPLLNNDLTGTVNAITDISKGIFPTATSSDYIDLISWIMANPIPEGANGEKDITQWMLNTISPEKGKPGTDHIYSAFLDYQFSKHFEENTTFTSGLTYEHIGTHSRVTGKHESDNIAGFAQFDTKFFDRLNVSLGARFEYYRVDSHKREAETDIFGAKFPVKPVFRGGLNYQLADHTFLRASFGQGYRYPSITEKYLVKNIGGVGAYPNPELKAEQGYNAEIGLKQAYKFGPFMGYFDIAGFYTYYKDMIEFEFGMLNPNPDKNYPFVTNLREIGDILAEGYIPTIGIKFSNVNRARIYGIDASFNGFCDISPTLKLMYNLGYVYTEPRDVDAKERNRAEESNTDMLAMKSKSNTSKYLKYRQKHTIKGTFDFQWERFSLGTNMMWKSKTLAVDYFLVDERMKDEKDVMDYVRSLIFGDLGGYWAKHNKDFFTMDMRMGVQVTKQVYLQFIINNLLNTEYSIRPMDVSAPRTYVVRTSLKF